VTLQEGGKLNEGAKIVTGDEERVLDRMNGMYRIFEEREHWNL
jgi:hypothetical protein